MDLFVIRFTPKRQTWTPQPRHQEAPENELDTVKETKHQQKNLDKGKKRGSRGGVRLKGSEARVGLVGED